MTSPTWKIREGYVTDAEAVLRLWRETEATPSVTDTLDIVRRVTTGREAAFILLAEEAGKLIGTVIAAYDGWRGNLYRLAVHPDYRRRGVATALVRAAEERLDLEGARRITALAEKDHPWATGFWEAAGYALDERMARYVGHLPRDTV